jgi:signal transduction histidine kinase
LDIQTEIAPSLQPIIIELLRNAALHSGASVINLEARRNENFILIEVSDNGIGEIQMKRNRFGLIGITEAISELSGHIEFLDTKPGLAIRVSIPA